MTARPSSAIALLAGAPVYAEAQDRLRSDSRRWLVTGGAGFIGSHLVESLLMLDQDVVVLDDLSTGRLSNLQAVRSEVGAKAARLRFFRGDVRDPSTLELAADHVDVILHQAALVSVPESIAAPVEAHDVNVTGFVRVLEAARTRGARVVFAASSASYGDDPSEAKREDRLGRPLSMYAATKTASEAYGAAYGASYGLPTVGLRYFNVFGARQDPNGAYAAVIPSWIAARARGERCTVYGDGGTTRDFCHVANVVGAVLLASVTDDPRAVGAAINVGTGVRTTLLELHDAIVDAVGRFRPQLPASRPIFGPYRPGDVRHSCADISRAREVLGYEPIVDLRTGIEATVEAALRRAAPPWQRVHVVGRRADSDSFRG